MPLTENDLSVAIRIKDETKQLHHDVETLLLPKLTSIESSHDYAGILKMFYGYFLPVENLIQRFITPSELADIKERRKAASILYDLREAGYEINDLPLCSLLPPIENTAQAFGALYVLEGSTLGGKMIAKMLQKNKAFTISEHMLHFFVGYKEKTGAKWTSFLQVLNQQERVPEIVASANDTFFYLKCWMQQSLDNE